MPKIREGRSIQIDSLCDFENVDDEQKVGFEKNKRVGSSFSYSFWDVNFQIILFFLSLFSMNN